MPALFILMKKIVRKTIRFKSPKTENFGDENFVRRIIKKYKLDE